MMRKNNNVLRVKNLKKDFKNDKLKNKNLFINNTTLLIYK